MSYKIINQRDSYGLYHDQSKVFKGIVDWLEDDTSLECVIKGSAGSGKTYLSGIIIQELLKPKYGRGFTVTAPTHKALTVVETNTRTKGITIQSLHGLKPDLDVADFDIDKLAFNTIGVPKMTKYRCFIVDEASMIPSGLLKLNRERSAAINCKIIYIGDPLQLPPVKEESSPVFDSVSVQFELKQIIRQTGDNPLMDVFERLRDDILTGDNQALRYIAEKRSIIRPTGGFKLLNEMQYRNEMSSMFTDERFHKDINFVRATAFTNMAVSNWNDHIRVAMGLHNKGALDIDDLITSYKTIIDDDTQAAIIVNSEDYCMADNIRRHRNEYGIDTLCIIMKDASKLQETKMLQIVDHRNPTAMAKYNEVLYKLRDNAIRVGGRKGWYPFHKFKNMVLCMKDIEVAGRTITRELDYGYTLTTHKLQGSTFQNIFVDGSDISKPITKYGKRYTNEPKFRNRLLYVAISRARHTAFIKF